MNIQIGVGDTFTHNKEHWVITDVKENIFVCKNKQTGAIVEFNGDVVRKMFR